VLNWAMPETPAVCRTNVASIYASRTGERR
jgi:hypothetical protein